MWNAYRQIAMGKRVEQLTGSQIALNDKRIKYLFNPSSVESLDRSRGQHM